MSVEDAEDAVHEAMVRAVEHGNMDDDRLAAWLTSVTMRLCVDRFRLLNREAEAHARWGLATPRQATVEEAVCDRAEAKWLAGRSAGLPLQQEQVLALRAQGLDLAQIAQRTGLGYQAARSLLARARKTLRAMLATTLAIATCLLRGRPRAAGGGAQTATLVSAAVTVTIAGIGLTAPSEAESGEAPGSRLRPHEAPLSAQPSRTPKRRRAPKPYEPTSSGLLPEPEYGLVLPTEQVGYSLTGAGPALSIPPSEVPSNPQGADLPALPVLPQAPAAAQPGLPELPGTPEPALPTVPDASGAVPPVTSTVPPATVRTAQPVELDSRSADMADGLPAADAPLLQH